MPEKKTKLRPDVNETAHRVMLEATGQAPKTLFRRLSARTTRRTLRRSPGGNRVARREGPARADALTDEERTRAAITAAHARWKEKDG